MQLRHPSAFRHCWIAPHVGIMSATLFTLKSFWLWYTKTKWKLAEKNSC